MGRRAAGFLGPSAPGRYPGPVAPLHNLPLRAMASAVWWALHTLLTAKEFWAGLAATLTGVLLAFELERWRDRRRARELYARALSAVRHESASLHAICAQALATIQATGGLTSYELEAPALRDFVASPSLQEHGPHRLAIILGSVLAFVGAARNSLDFFRRQVGLGGTPILAVHLAPLNAAPHAPPERDRARADVDGCGTPALGEGRLQDRRGSAGDRRLHGGDQVARAWLPRAGIVLLREATYANRCGHGQEVIPVPLRDGCVTFVPVLEEARWPGGRSTPRRGSEPHHAVV